MIVFLFLLPVIAGLFAAGGVAQHQAAQVRRAARAEEDAVRDQQRRDADDALRAAAEANRPRTEREVANERAGRDGVGVIRWLAMRRNWRLLPGRQHQAAVAAAESLVQQDFDTYGKPTLDRHPNLAAYLVVLVPLAALAPILFIIQWLLEVGVLETLAPDIGDKRWVLALIFAVAATLLGGSLLEVILPGEAFARLKTLTPPQRVGVLVFLATAFVGLLFLLATLSATRAETLHGNELIGAQATCAKVQADPTSTPDEIIVACDHADQVQRTLEKQKIWDQGAAVAAPVGEAVGVWALLRVLEVVVALRLKKRLVAAQQRTQAATDADAVAAAGEDLQIEEIVTDAGVTRAEFEAWERAQAAAPPVNPPPANPPADPPVPPQGPPADPPPQDPPSAFPRPRPVNGDRFRGVI